MEITTVKASAAIEAGRLDATHCHNCRAEFHSDGIGTGYATDPATGIRICYTCADIAHRAQLKIVPITGAYVSSDGTAITTWTGGQLMTVTSEVAKRLTHYRAVDVHGLRWYGKGAGRGMIITMRKAVAQ